MIDECEMMGTEEGVVIMMHWFGSGGKRNHRVDLLLFSFALIPSGVVVSTRG